MPEYYFRIAGRCKDQDRYSHWEWPPIWSDKVEAPNKKAAREMIEADFGRKLPMRVAAKDLDKHEFLLSLREIKESDHYTRSMFELRVCLRCGQSFRLIEKYQIGGGGGRDYCCDECRTEAHDLARVKFREGEGLKNPVIYKITNKITGKCYIGQTTQVFTLRWYQHFFQYGDCKFHKAIQETRSTDWTFEVVEIISMPECLTSMDELKAHINEREAFYIAKHNSIEDGYNTAKVGNQAVEMEER